MEYTYKGEIPDGKYCQEADATESCPFLVGELHSMCFLTGDDCLDDVYYEPEVRYHLPVLKCDYCPTKRRDLKPGEPYTGNDKEEAVKHDKLVEIMEGGK